MPQCDPVHKGGAELTQTTTGALALPLRAGQYQKKCSAPAVELTSKYPAYDVAFIPGSGPTLAAA